MDEMQANAPQKVNISYEREDPGAAPPPADVTPVSVTVTYDRDGNRTLSPPQRIELAVTPALAAAFARAAAANTGDATPLSFTSLLIGMISGNDDLSRWLRPELAGYGATLQKIADRRSRRFDESAFSALDGAGLSAPLAASLSARRALEEAQSIAAAIDAGPVLDLRHLAAAYPVLPDWHVEDFRELGIDRLAWCRSLGAFLSRGHPQEKWYWRAYADRASPVPLTSFSADVYTEKDLLGIDRTVDALALLMASTRTDTPLSIGVFGPWGSGKSFFMRHLRKRIWGLAAREQTRVKAWIDKRNQGTATADDAPLYYGQVAQVEFNAWHYNEGNLVASLVDHLFRNLRVLPGSDDTGLEQRRTDVLLKISGLTLDAQDAATAVETRQRAVDDARKAMEQAAQEASTARQDVHDKARVLSDTTEQAQLARVRIDSALAALASQARAPDAGALLQVALQPLQDSAVAADMRKAAGVMARELDGWRTFVSRLFTLRGAAVVLLCLAAPLAAWLTDRLSDIWAAVAGVATTGVAGLAHVIGLLRERRTEFEQTMKELETAEAQRRDAREKALREEAARIDQAWATKIAGVRATLEQEQAAFAEREAAVALAARTLAERSAALDQKVEERVSAEARLREAEAELKKLSSALLLDEFIRERSASDEYRKQLSFMALVRRDFERLSNLIAEANEEWSSPGSKTPPPLLNRIVLYIDDLDRCKVDTVIKVLEAVHLLLAFPLFVCVVAVDPRWIEHCLRDTNQHLFGDPDDSEGSHVTVGDYLEKIFQIPIWMQPIEDRQRASLVKALLGSTAAPAPRGTVVRGTATTAQPLQGADVPGAYQAGTYNSNAFQTIVKKAEETPDPLRITREEAVFVDRVAPLLSDKPRALKRFVNTYRLLKASLPDIDRQTFVADDPASAYRVCMSQLAFFTGRPRLAPALLRQLALTGRDDTTLAAWYDSLSPDARAPFAEALKLIPDRNQIHLREFRAWLPETTRYLFHRDDLLETRIENPDAAPTNGNAA